MTATHNKHIAVYPGTFDPMTNGHLDIMSRAVDLFDHLIVAIAPNQNKGPLFDHETRLQMLKEVINTTPKLKGMVEVQPMNSLLVDFVKSVGAKAIIRGLRAVSDFEYEFQMAGMNSHLAPEVETVFLMSSEGFQYISSRFIKEVASMKGDIRSLVPAVVFQHLQKKFDL
ncbi:pantetheine-phosphate adenylyltransferase [Candidatus Nucleicultrix amoebiphila]|jgi:pantetheine-phosphate adenylyltransferase|uniref:Phosphopantetheine adenylyltransferase n=1 Tax=Candidatus Nucleicultrix amoebiphila FS5 TaxID=1414854 RepID=A0A1W6N377_9PROT|nr:pantetheine-phosphate adenylyltransferase [Candidatus Nucleicultrix amoebiphila]ARN84330.1 phosphopantetheine adenylyltransferase [Candidatus Nucleicultrix amoebiphila FS5]